MSANDAPAQETAGTTDSDETRQSTDETHQSNDEPDAEPNRPRTRVAAAPAQVLAGMPLASAGKTACTGCDRTIREGDAVGVSATRVGGDVRFEAARVHCRHCRRERLPHPIPGTCQLIAFGRVAVTADATTREARLTLRDPEVVGHVPAE